MDLPNLLSKITTNHLEPQKFLAIEIGLEAVKVAIWQSDGKHTEVISIGSTQYFTQPTEKELLEAIDTSLSDALGSMSDEPDKVIFGLPDNWVENNHILESHKPLLKSICKQFNFHPIGFVVTTMAITHYLRDVEGGPPSAILVQTSAQQIAVSLIHLGDLISTQVVERSTSVATDIEEALGKIPHSGHLPSRIIYLISQEDPESIKQQLVSYDWQKKLSFLHLPKVETLPKEWSVKAIAISGGSEVIQSIKVQSNSDTAISSPPSATHDSQVTPPPSSLGFKPVQLDSSAAASLDIPTSSTPQNKPSLSSSHFRADNLEPAILPPSSSSQTKSKLARIPNFFKLFRSLKMPTISFPSPSKLFLLPLIIGALLLVLAGSAFWAYYHYPQAALNIDVAMNSYQQQIDFLIDPQATSTDFNSNILAGTKTTVDVSGSKTIPTTGTKLIGDRAKGKVIIFNRTNAPKTLKAGTTLKSNSLKFTLDTNVTVASASSKENPDFSVTIEPSKTESLVTAADIGAQYNLPKNTQFTVENYSTDTLFAVADTDFTGGSSQTVPAVSAADFTALKTALVKELQDQLASQTASTSPTTLGQISIGEPKINQEEYSAAKNEEVDELSLQLSMSQVVYRYNPSELAVIAQTAATKSLPADVQIRPDNTQVTLMSAVTNDLNQAQVTAQVVLYYIPRIDTTEVAKDLTNTPLDQLATKLSVLPGYQQHQITQSKFLFLHRLPPSPEQIVVHLVPVAAPSPAP